MSHRIVSLAYNQAFNFGSFMFSLHYNIKTLKQKMSVM